MQQETYKQIDGTNGVYEVSNLGNVKSNARKKGLLSKIVDSHGYFRVSLKINGKYSKPLVHRLVLSVFGELCKTQHVDHINGYRQDNRLENLRACSLEDNLRFDNVKKDKTSKYVGVSIKNGKWVAQIQVKNKKIFLGYYKNEEEAAFAYKKALNSLAQ